VTRELFHRELAQLQDDVLALGSMAEKAIMDAMQALRDGDVQWSQKIVEADKRVNSKRYEIEEKCIFIIGSQQPMASDLRALVSVLFITQELERIADHAEGIARINVMMGPEPLPRRLGYIPSMADRAVQMLRDSLRAYLEHDVALARQVCEADDEVDRIYDTIQAETIQGMIANPSTVERSTYLTWTCHNLERIADRCTNISERVIYLVTGQLIEINVSTY
jgi:phosphate transport system protein